MVRWALIRGKSNYTRVETIKAGVKFTASFPRKRESRGLDMLGLLFAADAGFSWIPAFAGMR